MEQFICGYALITIAEVGTDPHATPGTDTHSKNTFREPRDRLVAARLKCPRVSISKGTNENVSSIQSADCFNRNSLAFHGFSTGANNKILHLQSAD